MTQISDAPAEGDAVIRVELGARSYPVHVGVGGLDRAGGIIAPLLKRPNVVIVTDENVGRALAGRLEASLDDAGVAFERITLPPGESSKSFSMLERLCRDLLIAGVERSDLVIALGGGVIGDLVGFAAAILRRGVGFIQIPTSLLAQVDSSVGGKTAINTPEGKNLIGAFHQPRLVIADITALDSLPRREVQTGYAEVVKYGLLGDAEFFEWLEENGGKVVAGHHRARVHAVTRSIQAKADIVAADEREDAGRALLNLGHTFGHALEAATGYGDRLLHGEAVAIGMVLAFQFSERLGLCAAGCAERVADHLRKSGLRTRIAEVAADLTRDGVNAPLTADDLIALMKQDKKVSQGRLTFILARAVGDAVIHRDAPMETLRALMADACADRL